MGRIYGVSCKHCGYKARATTGGARESFRTVSLFPALCQSCQAIVSINEREARPHCPDCGSEDFVPYGAHTVLVGSATPTRAELFQQASALEQRYNADKPRRRKEAHINLLLNIRATQIVAEVVALLHGRHPMKRRNGRQEEKRLSWQLQLSEFFKVVDDELEDLLYSGWVNGRVRQSNFDERVSPSVDKELLQQVGYKLLELGIDVLDDDEEIEGIVGVLGRPLSELRLKPSDYKFASMNSLAIEAELEKADRGTYWQLQGVRSADEWVERVLSIKPDWYKGLHLCPRCKTHGLTFSPGILFD